jgi:hypothetical protein
VPNSSPEAIDFDQEVQRTTHALLTEDIESRRLKTDFDDLTTSEDGDEDCVIFFEALKMFLTFRGRSERP